MEVEVCRQSRLRGRIHARPSAGGLAALCASRFFLFLLSSSSRPVSFFHQRSRPDPGPRTPFGSTSTRSPPTRSSRTNPHSPGTIYNSLGIACKCKGSSAHPRFYTSNREPAGYDFELTRFAFEGMLANEREHSSINIPENIRMTILT